MKQQNQILLLRTCYWIGALIDAAAAIQLFLPDLWASFYAIPNYIPNQTLNYALATAGSLMIGWTLLLIWADRKPVERKGVLPLTVFPVVAGLALNNVSSVAVGLRTFASAAPTIALQVGLSALFIFSYLNVHKEVP
jgi:hypothetical protein